MKPDMFFYGGVEPQNVPDLINRYGQDILIGAEVRDPNFNAIMDEVVYCGGLMHAHLGPVMVSELEADSMGIDISKKSWIKQWKNGAWKRYVLRQIELYDRLGFYSISFDLSTVFSTSLEWLFFLRDVDIMCWDRNVDIKWMLWDVSDNVLSALIESVRNREIRKHQFAPFAVLGPGTGDCRKQDAFCDMLGIRAVTPEHDLPNLHKGVLADHLTVR